MRPLLGLALGVLLGLGACDDEAPEQITCTDWLRCYSSCRDGQHARGDDQALTQDELHDLCISECTDVRRELTTFPEGLDVAMKNPEDAGYFWDGLTVCLDDGA